MKRKVVVDIIAACFILLLLYTALSKLLEFAVFRFQLGLSPLLAPIAGFIAWIIPIMEIMIVLLLLFPGTKLRGLYAAAALMVLFTGYVVIMLTTYDHLPCTCGGIVSRLSWPAHLVLNIACTILAVIGILIKKHKLPKVDSTPPYKP